MYESDLALQQYLLFHYGTAEDQLPYSFGPVDALFYPIRCVTEFIEETAHPQRALDLGCAVGRSTFEISRYAQEVIGIDLSHRFIDAALRIQKTGSAHFNRILEGALSETLIRELPKEIDRARCHFEVGDALNLRKDLGEFDFILAANLLDRVPSPRLLLENFSNLIRPNGYLVLCSPYTWLSEFTPPNEWLDGHLTSSGPTGTLANVQPILEPHFDLVRAKDLPFLISETARKYQWSVAQATLWRRKSSQ